MDTQGALEKYNSYPITQITVIYVVIYYIIRISFDNGIIDTYFISIPFTMLKTVLIGVLICVFTKTNISKGIINGAVFGFIGSVSNILLELSPQISTIISAPLLGAFVSVLTKSNVAKGVIYGVLYSVFSYIIYSVINPLSAPFQFDFIIYRLIETLANYHPSIHHLIHSILTNTLFSIFIGMLINHKGAYITRSVFGGVIFGVISYIVYTVSPNILNMDDIIVQVLYVNYLFFILYPLTLQKTDVVATMTTNDSTTNDSTYNDSTDNDSTYTTTTNYNSSVERDQVFQKGSKINWLYVISRTLIGAIIGTIIVYIFMMIKPNSGGSFGFFTNVKSFFALIIAVIYGGAGGAIIGFIVALSFPKTKDNNTDKNL